MMKIGTDIMMRLLAAVVITGAGVSCSEGGMEPASVVPTLESSSNPIEYRTSLQTRAAGMYHNASYIKEFHVWSAVEGGSKGGIHFIPGDAMVRQEDGKYVQSDGLDRYWPQPGTKLGFFAVSGLETYDSISWSADSRGKDVCVTLKNYLVERNKEVKHDDAHGGSNEELKTASESTDDTEEEYEYIVKDEEFDIIVAATGAIDSPQKNASGTSAVSLDFTHALSCIEFHARNIDPAIDVEITGIGLKHIQNIADLQVYLVGDSAGTFKWNLPNLEIGAKQEEGESLQSAGDRRKPTFKIPLEKSVVLHGDAAANSDESLTVTVPIIEKDWTEAKVSQYALMMIPQQLHAFNPHQDDENNYRPHGASLMLRANIWNVADDTGIHKDNDKKVWGGEPNNKLGEWMLLPCGDKWEPGKRYVYTVTFGGEGRYGGYEEDEVKDDKDRVFDPISFEVEIEPWIPGGDIVQNIY